MKLERRDIVRCLRHPLGGSVAFLIGFYVAMKLLLAPFGGWLAAEGWFSVRRGLASTGREASLYGLLAVIACLVFLTYDEQRWQEFQRPIWAFLRWRHRGRTWALAGLPLVVGALILINSAMGAAEPVSNPIKHPTPPDELSKMTNPYRDPTPEMLASFDRALQGGVIDAGESAEPKVRDYALALAAGEATPEAREEAFRRRAIEEGRVLFMINCRPCHGTKAMGDGPMSLGQRRAPAEFTGVETIATLVEGAVFWRVNKGGVGLPREGAPWESAMPRWELDLSADEIWKVILAEYDLAGNSPRQPEKLEVADAPADGTPADESEVGE